MEGDLSPAEASRFEAHSAGCPACTQELAWAKTIQRELAALPQESCPEPVVRRVLASAAAAPLPFRPAPRVRAWVPALLAAGLAVATLGLSFLVSRTAQDDRMPEVAPTGGPQARTATQKPAQLTAPAPELPEGVTAADVERAEREARLALAYLGTVTRKIGATVQEELVEAVFQPRQRGEALDGISGSPERNGDRLQ